MCTRTLGYPFPYSKTKTFEFKSGFGFERRGLEWHSPNTPSPLPLEFKSRF